MEQPVSLQAAQLLCSLAGGVWLGLVYDALRAVRRLHPKSTPFLDLLFVLSLLPFLYKSWGLGLQTISCWERKGTLSDWRS